MRRRMTLTGTYVLAAALLLALGAAARYSGSDSREATSVREAGQMGKGMMGQNMAAAREQMETIVDKLVENHTAMARAKSLTAMRPLLEVNRTLLNRLRDEMNVAWGMHGHGRRSTTVSRHTAPASRRTPPAASARESKLVARGRHLFAVDSCRVCHGPTAHGTAMAPSLHGVGKKYSAEHIAHLIRHPVTQKMPSFSESAVTDADLKAIVAFLETLK